MIVVSLFAVASTAAFLTLWFRIAWRELRAKSDIMASANSQFTACTNSCLQSKDDSGEQDAKSVLSRSEDIYRQSITIYNQALKKPQNRIPAFLMGFRPMQEPK